MKLTGIFPAIPTCFTQKGEIDPEAQKRVIQFTIEAGADGIVFPGVASEYKFLTADERGQLIRLLVDEVAGRIPLIAGISASHPQEVISLGLEASRNGIKRFMLMAPSHLGHDLEKHQAFFSEVAQAFPDSEIMLQNAPSPIGAGLTAACIIQIVEQIPAISYIKEETLPSGPTITALLNHDIPHLKGVFGGGGARYIIDELKRGALGAVPAVELTDLHASLFKAWQKGDTKRARELYQMSLPLLTAQKVYRMELTKYILKKRGILDSLYVRAPLPKPDTYALQDIDQIWKDLKATDAIRWRASS